LACSFWNPAREGISCRGWGDEAYPQPFVFRREKVIPALWAFASRRFALDWALSLPWLMVVLFEESPFMAKKSAASASSTSRKSTQNTPTPQDTLSLASNEAPTPQEAVDAPAKARKGSDTSKGSDAAKEAKAFKESTMTTTGGMEDGGVQFALVMISLLVYATQLGFGLWDCWEPHYAETARMMVIRKDWVHPYWSYAYFLSKPPLLFWYPAASISLFGMNEWALRLPFALHAVFLIWGVYFITSRLFTMRAGILAAVVVGTMPLTGFLGRQVLVDIILVSYLTTALGFLALAVFGGREAREKAALCGERPPIHLPYLVGFYILIGLTLLAKGFLGLGIAGAVFLGYLAFSFDLQSLFRLRMVMGTGIVLLIALPWYAHMSFFPGRNIDDHKTFFERFILYDNFQRIFRGVHGERGDFVYFIRQMGYALGGWIGFLPFGLWRIARFRQESADGAALSPDERLRRFLFSWWLIVFLFLSLSQTKFHHYIFPLLPISAILIALWMDDYLRYREKPLMRFALIVIFALLVMILRDLISDPKHLINLFVYKYERAYPTNDPPLLFASLLAWLKIKSQLTPEIILRNMIVFFGFMLALGFFYEMRKAAIYGFCGIALLWTVYNNHVFMIHLTKHWSQRGLFDTLKRDSALWKAKLDQPWIDGNQEPIPAEPLIAFKMNWRGEKFYSRNFDLQIMGTNSYNRLYNAVERLKQPGRPMYFLTEASRLDQLKRGVGSYNAPHLRVIDNSNNKYILVKMALPPVDYRKDKARLERDAKNRKYYDDWAKNWKKNQQKRPH
jgi:4-amino-4-deoxy-L-arabinose transferase-like glycosyltransferase